MQQSPGVVHLAERQRQDGREVAGTDGDRRLRPRPRKCRRRTSLRARPVVCHQHEDRLLIEGDGHRVVAKALRGLGDGVGHARHRLEVATTEVQYRLGEQGACPQRRNLRAPMEGTREPAQGFGQLSPRQLGSPRAGGELQGQARLLVERARERGAQVVHLGVEPRRRFEDDGHTAVGIVTRRLLRVPGPMALDACRQLTSITELSLGVLPHHLEHAEAGGLARRLGRHQGLVDETTEHVDDVADRGHGGGGIEVEAAREHGQTTERDALVVEQEVVTPVEGGGQGLLAVRMAAPATGEDGERIAQAGGELCDREVDDTHGGQLEGEGDAVETATDLGDRGGGGGIEHEARRRVPRSLDEQLDGFETSQTVGRVVISRKLERGHPPGDLAGVPERLAARGQDDEIGASRQELGGQGDDGVEDVLAVVENEQDRPARELVDERGDPRPVALEGSSRAPPTADGTPSPCVTPASSTSHTPSAQRELAT